jgi:ribosome-associated translation inhibitor RaiA
LELVFSHRGIALTQSMLKKAETAVLKAAKRIPRATSATVRFEEDGPERRVEIVFTAPRGTRLVAVAAGRYWGPALTSALSKLVRQASKERRTPQRRTSQQRTSAKA